MEGADGASAASLSALGVETGRSAERVPRVCVLWGWRRADRGCGRGESRESACSGGGDGWMEGADGASAASLRALGVETGRSAERVPRVCVFWGQRRVNGALWVEWCVLALQKGV